MSCPLIGKSVSGLSATSYTQTLTQLVTIAGNSADSLYSHNTLSGGSLLQSLSGSSTALYDAWSVELRDLDESLESSLVDPSSSGTLFIRLLVKTVGVLKCEEDIERMILEGVAAGFRGTVQRLREVAMIKLQSVLASREETDELHIKLCSEYIGSLMDASLLTMHRLMYVRKLLALSKLQRQRGDKATVENSMLLKDANSRKLVMTAWKDMEETIMKEMDVHLVEPEVENITDRATGTTSSNLYRAEAGGGGGGLFDLQKVAKPQDGFLAEDLGADDILGEEQATQVFKPSARHAASIYKTTTTYSLVSQRMFKDCGLDEIDRSSTVSNAGGFPSNRFSNSALNRTEKNAGLTSIQEAAQQYAAAKDSKILSRIQVFIEEELLPVVQSTVNNEMRAIQLNNVLFCIIDDNGIICDGVTDGTGTVSNLCGTASAAIANGTAPTNSGTATGNGAADKEIFMVLVCPAAQICATTVQPLFTYWVQLNLHRGMVATVIDRVVRAYSSAAREELENLSYHLLSAQDTCKAAVDAGTKADRIFYAYRSKLYGGRPSLEDMFSGQSTNPEAKMVKMSSRSNDGMSVSFSMSMDSQDGSNFAAIASLARIAASGNDPPNQSEFGEDWYALWSLGDSSYPITKDNVSCY